jgi:thiosulfate dehydrogenase (quinone) large subunit
VNGIVWVRILVGAVWLNGAVEKLLNPNSQSEFELQGTAKQVGD